VLQVLWILRALQHRMALPMLLLPMILLLMVLLVSALFR
jgi:hypothetical protein